MHPAGRSVLSLQVHLADLLTAQKPVNCYQTASTDDAQHASRLCYEHHFRLFVCLSVYYRVDCDHIVQQTRSSATAEGPRDALVSTMTLSKFEGHFAI